MKLKILTVVFLTLLIKVFLFNTILDFSHYNLFNGGMNLLYFLGELVLVLLLASIMYVSLGKIKDQSVSYGRGLMWTLVICLILFVGFNATNAVIDKTRPHKYAITIVQGDELTIQEFKQLESDYPEEIMIVENINSFEELSPSMTMERELKETPFINIFVNTGVKTGYIGLDTYDIEEAISYLESRLE